MSQSQNSPRAWYWKTRNCMQLQHIDVALAVAEYLRNVIAQVFTETQKPRLPYNFWTGEDLRKCTLEERKSRKQQLMKQWPGLLSGPHGAHIGETSTWLPQYVVRATLPRSSCAQAKHDTDLKICIVLWQSSIFLDSQVALSFFNNHLDSSTHLFHFVVDGATAGASVDIGWTGPELQGLGFMHASQVLFQEVDRYRKALGEEHAHKQAKKRGVSFRVGHHVAELHWKTSNNVEVPVCYVAIQDLTPQSLSALQSGSVNNIEVDAGEIDGTRTPSVASPAPTQGPKKLVRSIAATYRWRVAYKMAETASGIERATEPSHEVSLVQSDEVAITVLGLPPNLTPEYVFSGIYGVIPPQRSWCIPSRTPQSPRIHFYIPHADTQRARCQLGADQPPFYYCDRLVPFPPPLNRLGVNYIGNLCMTPDRSTIVTRGALYDEYKAHLSAAADFGIRTIPDLAVELALDILTDNSHSDGTISRVLNPADAEASEAYRTAFVQAWIQLDPSTTSESSLLYPFCGDADQQLVQELGMAGRRVSERVREILLESGAFPDIKTHAESLLLQAHPFSDSVVGLDRLARMLAAILPELADDCLSVRRYDFAEPRIVWDPASQTFVMGSLLPACEEHVEVDCLCWVGPYLDEAVSCWEAAQSGGKRVSKATVCRAYVRCMDGTVDLCEPEDIPLLEHGSSPHSFTKIFQVLTMRTRMHWATSPALRMHRPWRKELCRHTGHRCLRRARMHPLWNPRGHSSRTGIQYQRPSRLMRCWAGWKIYGRRCGVASRV
ncbi:hypothetical protein B0H21DRAFT_234315 [Amylocystis lapponica]|nr:hypothetical protein B0H21DRAFT_234315 [Amylocystis lapponica]